MDLTINLGHIIQIIVIVGGGLWAIWEMRTKLALVHTAQKYTNDKIVNIESELGQLARMTIEIARQDERMNAQDLRIQELSNRLAQVTDLTPKPRKMLR